MNYAPIRVINVSHCKYVKAAHHRRHCHNFYHLMYFLGGKGTIWVNDQKRDAQQDCIYMVAPGVYHEYVNDPINPLQTMEVKFIINDKRLAEVMEALPSYIDVPSDGVKVLMQFMLKEAEENRLFYKEIIMSTLMQLLYQLLRQSSPDNRLIKLKQEHASSAQSANNFHYLVDLMPFPNDPCDKIRQYIHTHYPEKMTLSIIAKRFALNRTHLCTLFSEKYGISPIQYLNNLRIHKVKELLADSRLSITEISAQVGFQNVHHLSRYFSSREGLSPLQYRQKHHSCVYIKVDEKLTVERGFLADSKWMNNGKEDDRNGTIV